MLNKTIVIGRLTRDTELRYTQSGKAVCSGTVANNKKYGDDKEKVLFLDFTVWEKRGEALNKHLKKGDAVLLEGSLETQKWTDKESGKERSKVVLVVQNWEFLPRSKESEDTAEEKVSEPEDKRLW